MSTWVNGRRAHGIDCRDRGLQYGDGVFETLCVRRRAVRLLDYHLERLEASCRRLMIDPPDEQRLRGEIGRAAATRGSAVLKLIVTRGVGPRGYRPTGRERSTRILTLGPPPGTKGRDPPPLRVRVCATRLGSNPALAGLKTLNRLESVLARSEWSGMRVREGLMMDMDENFVCGTMSNLFLRRGKILMTPLLDRCGVAGVMRRWVLEQAGVLSLSVLERRIRWADIRAAEEVFMTNALNGPMPVAEIANGRERVRPPAAAAALALRARLEAL